MNRTLYLAAAAALIVMSLPHAHAASTPRDPSAAAKTTLEEIDALSSDIADTAFQLNDMARDHRDAESHLDGLAALRDDVNKIGDDLQSLQEQRSGLSEWESDALDKSLPLMHNVAGNVEDAIAAFSASRTHLWASSYVEDTAAVARDAGQVANMVRDYIKLAKTREKEVRLEHNLGETSTPGPE